MAARQPTHSIEQLDVCLMCEVVQNKVTTFFFLSVDSVTSSRRCGTFAYTCELSLRMFLKQTQRGIKFKTKQSRERKWENSFFSSHRNYSKHKKHQRRYSLFIRFNYKGGGASVTAAVGVQR